MKYKNLNILENIPLKNFTTFKIGGNARYFVKIKEAVDLESVIEFANLRFLPVFVLGGGSDILVDDKGLQAVVVHLAGKDIRITKKNKKYAYVMADAGVVWDEMVSFSVKNNLQGIESLSGIPGSVGASPVQNIGAYGQELKDTFYILTAYDKLKNKISEFKKKDCRFSYRESIFKSAKYKGRFIITDITLKLNINKKPSITYDSLKNYLIDHNIDEPSLFEVRNAVLQIRKGKFEDPKMVGNAGSFFKNPIVAKRKMQELRKDFPDIPCHDAGKGKCKVFAGWFIEKAGWKGKKHGNAAVSPKHALVITNPEGKAFANDVKKLALMIQKDVFKKFGIKLEREVQYVDQQTLNNINL